MPAIRRGTIGPILLLAVGAAPACAQGVGTALLVGYGALSIGALTSLATRNTPPTVDVGAHVKVRLRGSAAWSDPTHVTHVDADSVVVQGESASERFARSEIDSLQIKVSTGRWAEGWAIGLLAGGAVGAATGYTTGSNGSGDDWFTPGEGAVIVGVAFGVAGSVLGAGIGLLAPSRWVTIGNSREESRFSIAPTVGRHGFVAQFRF